MCGSKHTRVHCSICRGHLVYRVDDDGFNGNLLRPEQKARCLLECHVEGGEFAVRVRCRGVAKTDVIAAQNTGLVDYGETGGRGELQGQLKHGPVGAAHLPRADIDPEAREVISLGEREVRATTGDNQAVSTGQARLRMRHQMKAFAQQILQARLQFVPGQLNPVFRFGGDVVEGTFEPARLIGNLAIVNPIRQLQQKRERYVGCGKSANARRTPAAGVGVGLRRRGPYARNLKRRPWSLRVCCRKGREKHGGQQEKTHAVW